jgi:branched-subunit amino acid aminotransferase/4-amino-4-deoxychorismate lyase
MKELVSFNGDIVKAGDSRIIAVSSAALYGKGVFTTVAINDGKPFLWEKHWRRLNENAKALGIDISKYSETAVRATLDRIAVANDVESGRVRVTFFDESAGGIWPFEIGRGTSLLITAADRRPNTGPLRLALSPYAVNSGSPLAGIKSCNYLENILTLNEAKERGFGEAIRLNERGRITSACMANVFWLKDGRLFTPPLSAGCLAGTTREFIMERFDCSEIEDGMEAIKNADAVFLTSAGLGVAEAAGLSERAFERSDHPILKAVPRPE